MWIVEVERRIKMKKHSSFRLRWSRYYQYILEGQVFFLKQKAYTNKNDGYIDWEMITEQTYKDAMKRGSKDNVVVVEEEVSIAPVQPLTLIFNEIYSMDETDVRRAVIEAQESIRELRKHTKIKSGLEYRIFKKILELQIKQIQEDCKEVAI